jgi:hypothetical protein
LVPPPVAPASFTLAVTVVTASYGGVKQRIKVVVAPQNAITLASLTIVPNRVTGGSPALATVMLNRPAPFGGAQVTIEARRRNIVTMPNVGFPKMRAGDVPMQVAILELPGVSSWLPDDMATYSIITKRRCTWRCYCWPDQYNCEKIPQKQEL